MKNLVYTHPAEKVCNYSYTHPPQRVCNFQATEFGFSHKAVLLHIDSTFGFRDATMSVGIDYSDMPFIIFDQDRDTANFPLYYAIINPSEIHFDILEKVLSDRNDVKFEISSNFGEGADDYRYTQVFGTYGVNEDIVPANLIVNIPSGKLTLMQSIFRRTNYSSTTDTLTLFATYVTLGGHDHQPSKDVLRVYGDISLDVYWFPN